MEGEATLEQRDSSCTHCVTLLPILHRPDFSQPWKEVVILASESLAKSHRQRSAEEGNLTLSPLGTSFSLRPLCNIPGKKLMLWDQESAPKGETRKTPRGPLWTG